MQNKHLSLLYGSLLGLLRGLLLCSLFMPSLAWSLSKDVEQPVNIEADTVMFNNEKGVADYQGHVIILQGSLEIRANKVNIQAPNHEIISIVATGKPVKMQQTMDDGQIVKGQGNTITYQVKGKKIVLTGNAKLEQGKDMISNNNITYLPGSGELTAGGKKNSGRVKAIFHPSNKVKKPANTSNNANDKSSNKTP
jgi:lipopolysaccharide export system protein LptA